jgi:hypothetical protein
MPWALAPAAASPAAAGLGTRYDRGTLMSDLLAALIVTIMLIPQSLAYALLAGLPPEVGCMPAWPADCCMPCSARAARWP